MPSIKLSAVVIVVVALSASPIAFAQDDRMA